MRSTCPLLLYAALASLAAACSRPPERAREHARPARTPAITDVYAAPGMRTLSGAVKSDLARVDVPDLDSNDVTVIDPVALKVVDRYPVGRGPQHVVPSFDLRTLWVTGSAQGKIQGSLTPIDPISGKPGPVKRVEDAYNMYFTPDGTSALVVAESRKRLDYRDPRTMTLQGQLPVPNCSASTTRTSPRTARMPSSPASSQARWRRSTSGTARCWDTCRSQSVGCRRTSGSRPTAAPFTSPT